VSRGSILRSLVAFVIGLVVLGGILFVATTVDGRAPAVDQIRLTHHLSSDDAVALTTTSIQVVFSEAVDHPSAEAAFNIEPEVQGAYSWNASTLVFTPEERLPLETDFVATVQPGVRDAAGNPMEQEASLAFVTVGNPTVVASQPEPNQADVPLASAIVLQFSTLMDTASVEEALAISPEIELTPSWSGEALTLTPVEPLGEGVDYMLSIGTDARDSAGTPLERSYLLSFGTVSSGLSASIVMPADDAEGISTRTPIAVVFDRALDAETLDDGLFAIEPDVAGSLEVVEAPGAAGMREPGARVLRFQPSAPLQANTTYQVTVGTELVGTDGAALAEPLAWRFTTGAPLASLSNQIVFLSDRSGIDNLWAMNPDGTGQRQLSVELSPTTTYAVAPDGRSLIVGDGARLVMQQADGSGRRRPGNRPGLLAGRRAGGPQPGRPGDRRRAGAVDQVRPGRRRQPDRAARGAGAGDAITAALRRGSGARADPARPALLARRGGAGLRRHERASGGAGAAGRPAHHRPLCRCQPAGLAARCDRRPALRLARRGAGTGRAGTTGHAAGSGWPGAEFVRAGSPAAGPPGAGGGRGRAARPPVRRLAA
jgi:hypothetical protein